MGAETRVYVLVSKSYQEWVKVSAVTLDEAMTKALALPDVEGAIRASHDHPLASQSDGEVGHGP